MRLLIARFLLVFAVLGLPFQTVVAATISICETGGHHGVQTGGHPVHHPALQGADNGQPCCADLALDGVHCHHCGGAAIPSCQYRMDSDAGVAYVPAVPPHFSLFVPELPKPPPVA